MLSLTPREVGAWLEANNLGNYSQIFEENEISGEILSQLSSSMLLTELGVKALGHRVVIMNAFKKSTKASIREWLTSTTTLSITTTTHYPLIANR